MNGRPQRKLRDEDRFRFQELQESASSRRRAQDSRRQLREERVVLGLGLEERGEQLCETGIGAARSQESQPLAAPGFDDSTDEESIGESLLSGAPDPAHESPSVRIRRAAPEGNAASLELGEQLEEMPGLFLGQLRERTHDRPTVRIGSHDGQCRGRSLLLAMGVIGKKVIEVPQSQAGPP